MSIKGDNETATSADPPASKSRIRGTGEMADRIRSYPWQDSLLGSIDTWPPELTVMINMMLSTGEMAAVYWGPEMILLYNDVYLPHLTSKHPALGKPFWVVWEEARSQVGELMESPFNTGKTFVTPPLPLELIRDGRSEQTYYSMTGSPIIVPNGVSTKVGGVYLTLTDQTANVLRAQQLAATEARAGRVLASIGDAVIVTDAEGQIKTMNGVAEQLTMWTEAAALRQSISSVFQIVNEETRAVVACPVKKVRETGLVAELAKHTLLIGKDGLETSIDDSAAPIRSDAGDMIGVVLVFRDVGERRAMERARAQDLNRLLQEEEHLQVALGATQATAFNWDLAADSVRWTGRSPLGRKAEELSQPATVFGFIHAEDRPQTQQTVELAIAGGTGYTVEYRAFWPDDSIHWLRSSAVVLRDEAGVAVRLLGVDTDITMQKQVEATLLRTEKLAAVGRLASTMAHEINNPLEAVTNLLYLARQSRNMEEAHPLLETADSELRRAATITNQAMRFHKQASKPTSSSFESLTHDLFAGRHSRLRNAGAKTEIRDRTSRPVLCFEGEIRQVLNNLVGNAIDALSANGGRLLLRGRDGRDWATGRMGMVLTIADTGSGMSQLTQEKLFDAFFTTKGIGGTGLGLWVSKEIVVRHVGRLQMRSSDKFGGQGSVFTIFLPYDAARRESATPAGS